MFEIFLHFRLIWYGLLSLLVSLMIGLSVWNSKAVSAIDLRLRDGVEEHMDKRLPVIQDPRDALPDYRVTYLVDGDWHLAGTAINTSAKDWLTFDLSDAPNFTLLQAIRVVDEDPAENDALEEVRVVEDHIEGAMFEYRLESTRRFKAGLDWFATTALGKAIFGGIALAFLILILGNLS